MKFLFFLLCLQLSGPFWVHSRVLFQPQPPGNFKIVGGQQVANGGAPYQVAVFRNGAFHCGGSLIGSNRVLTAAHCVSGYESLPGRFKVRYGTLYRVSGSDLPVVSVVRHPSYNSTTFDYDVALLFLGVPFVPGVNAATIPLARAPPFPGSQVSVTGWGFVHSSGQSFPLLLQRADNLTIKSRDRCQEAWTGQVVTDRMICALSMSQSACTGDSGGPVVQNGELVGVVSWSSSWCLHPTHPGVYANVAQLRSWIRGVTDAQASGTANGAASTFLLTLAPLNPMIVTSFLYQYLAEKWYTDSGDL